MATRVERALEAAAADSNNAFTAIHDEAAQVEATPGPLAGMPIAVKDLIDQAGQTTTAGSAFYRHAAATTAPALARLQSAGAVSIGRTNLHEFAFGFSSENPWFDPVRNPWDQSLSPGGSSGGSAAAVAAGIVPVAIGTDTGGSVRVPAALCGVVGLKVTYGLIPLDGVFPLVPSLDTVGAIAGSLDDLEIATAVMAGGSWGPPPGSAPVRLVVPEGWISDAPLSPAIGADFEEFLAAAGDAGLVVERRHLPRLGSSPLQGAVIGPEVAAIHGTWRAEGRPYGDDVAARIDTAVSVSEDTGALAEARAWSHELRAAMEEATAHQAVVVTPTVAAMDKRIGEDRIGEHHYRTVLSWFTAPVNTAGCPALAIPLAGAGRRPSIQLIGSRGSERRLLAVARLLEKRAVLGVSRLPSA